jgi:hypothetical protein
MAVPILWCALEFMTTANSKSRSQAAIVLPAVVFILALALYVRTGAPSLLTGDQAEHQMVASLVGVPHATGYPFFTMVNALAVHLIPLGDAARRVTLVTAFWSALAVTAAFLVAQRMSASAWAGLIAAATLAVSPRFWSLSIITEVYTLQALFILLIWRVLLNWWEAPDNLRLLGCLALLTGLALTHHGSFIPIVLPALIITVLPSLWRVARTQLKQMGWPALRPLIGWPFLCFALGLMPWLYLVVQFVIYRPFDYYRSQGLPYHYYWGNPARWADVANLALGAGFRAKVFTHGWGQLPTLLFHAGEILRGELWWSGLALACVGFAFLLRRDRRSAALSGIIFVSAALFGINVAGDVPKAPVYFLPMYVVASVWAGVGAAWLMHALRQRLPTLVKLVSTLLLIILISLPLARGLRWFALLDRSEDHAPREIATGVLDLVEPHAVILCRWEACLPIEYLQLVEHRRLDVQVDQTEPEDGVSWADRAALYYPTRPVYAIQFNQQLAAHYPIFPVSETFDLWQIRAFD